MDHSLPFSGSLHLLPLRSTVKYVREIQRASIAPFGIFVREDLPTWLGTMGRGWLVRFQHSPHSARILPFQRKALYRIHKLEAAKPALSQHFFMSERHKLLETLSLSLARLRATQRSASAYEDRGALRGTPGSAYPQPEPNATELPSSATRPPGVDRAEEPRWQQHHCSLSAPRRRCCLRPKGGIYTQSQFPPRTSKTG